MQRLQTQTLVDIEISSCNEMSHSYKQSERLSAVLSQCINASA